jgi:hypothetical protein
MALPPKGDPRRPLHLAIRSTRVLAILFLALGLCGMIPFLIGAINVGGRGMPVTFMAMSVLLFYFGPGVAYLILSIYLGHRRYWAIVASIVLASIQVLFCLIGIMSMAWFILPTSSGPEIYIPVGLIILVILALAQLIYHLALSFESIKYAPVEQQRGFEPIPMATALSPPPPIDPNQLPPTCH